MRSTFNGLATSDDLIKNKPDLVERFVRATRKGMIYTRNHREESIERFADYMKAKPEDRRGRYDLLRTLMALTARSRPMSQTTRCPCAAT